ncbi:MAG: phospholipid carrier-dependent glycosyltransferase [bacterium]|nr:phospholipid carrier-dependent glycosyltransferase [bacterium]
MKKEKAEEVTWFKKVKSYLRDNDHKLKRNDWIIMGGMVLLYSILAFHNLGTLENPQTFYHFQAEGTEVGIELEKSEQISMARVYAGPEIGNYNIFGSNDGSNFTFITTLEQNMVFSWYDIPLDQSYQYFKFVSKQDNSYLGEIQLYNQYGEKVIAKASDDQSAPVLDEPDTVPSTISYKNSAYFDEIYFARSAYEYIHGIPTNEWVHPPLGKLIMMIPILLFGMNTFAYRLMGNIAGIFMIPVIYILAKRVFKNRKWAILASLLMLFDCFHFAQTRMGTVDSFLVLFIMLSALFMYQYILLKKKDPLSKKLTNLFLSGLFIGCAIATKWTGLYAGLALAIVFFTHLVYHNTGKRKKDKDALKIVLSCCVFFIVVPLIIYIASYLLFPAVYPGKVEGITGIIKQTKNMFSYHSNLTETHPFSSEWYTWPIMAKPVWYYVGYYGGNIKSTIVGIGNPAIWWGGIVAGLFVLAKSILNRRKEDLFILAFVLCCFLPYLWIGRVMFMYHYFPVLPFLMLAIVSLIKWITEKIKNNSVYLFYVAIVVLLFICFYPVVSGMMTTTDYVNSLRWFSSWIF